MPVYDICEVAASKIRRRRQRIWLVDQMKIKLASRVRQEAHVNILTYKDPKRRT